MSLWRYAFWMIAAWTLFWVAVAFTAGRASAQDGRSHACMTKGALLPRCVVIGPPRS